MPDPTRKAMQGAIQHRREHRRRSHDEAHTDTEAGPHDPHTRLVTDQVEFNQLLGKLNTPEGFAFDTEFIGELTYRPQLCLVQVATHEGVWLLDPLAGLDLGGFWKLLADASVPKVLHAGEQDLSHAWTWSSEAPANVIDTQIAAGFVGLGASLSLAKLILETTGKSITKGFTLTDWSRRPLSASQLRYATDDVRYLPAAWGVLGRRVRESGVEGWVREECAARCAASRPDTSVESAVDRVRGASTLDPQQRSVLAQLASWRESTAQQADLPPRSLVRDEVLIDLARRAPNTTEKLHGTRHLPRPVVEHHAPALLEAIARGKAQAPPRTRREPGDDEPAPGEKFRTDGVWAVAQAICCAKGVDPTLVTSRRDLQDLLTRRSRQQPLDDLPLLHGWRRTLLGDPLLAWLDGKSQVCLSCVDGRVSA